MSRHWPFGGAVSLTGQSNVYTLTGMARVAESILAKKPFCGLFPPLVNQVVYVTRNQGPLLTVSYPIAEKSSESDDFRPIVLPWRLGLDSKSGLDWLAGKLTTVGLSTVLMVSYDETNRANRFPPYCESLYNLVLSYGLGGLLVSRVTSATWVGFSYELEVNNRAGQVAVKTDRVSAGHVEL